MLKVSTDTPTPIVVYMRYRLARISFFSSPIAVIYRYAARKPESTARSAMTHAIHESRARMIATISQFPDGVTAVPVNVYPSVLQELTPGVPTNVLPGPPPAHSGCIGFNSQKVSHALHPGNIGLMEQFSHRPDVAL